MLIWRFLCLLEKDLSLPLHLYNDNFGDNKDIS